MANLALVFDPYLLANHGHAHVLYQELGQRILEPPQGSGRGPFSSGPARKTHESSGGTNSVQEIPSDDRLPETRDRAHVASHRGDHASLQWLPDRAYQG